MDPRLLFESELGLIDAVVSGIGRRHHLYGEQVQEFLSYTRLKLIEDDYARLRSFSGRSSLRTYLAAVIHRLFLDFQIERWGKWRASAVARSLGPVAVALETLMHRDGHSLQEAFEILRTNQGASLSWDEALEIASQVPVRARRRHEGEESLARMASDGGTADATVLKREQEERLARIEMALQRAIAGLAGDDRLILKMRFGDGFTVAKIASTLQVEQRLLYRRLEKLLLELKLQLTREGVEPEEVKELIGRPDVEIRLRYDVAAGKAPFASV